MISLSQQRWYTTLTSIASELASQTGEACASLGRWVGDSAKENDPRVMVATLGAVIAIAVTVAILLSTVVPYR